MLGEQLLKIWEDLPPNPEGQLKAVREYAARVFGSDLYAASWLGRTHPEILAGSCVISEACRTREGFRAAVRELMRLDRRTEGSGA
jgi:hypothetical protein